MKGTPDEPMCGFSRAAVIALRSNNAAFHSFNVLSDPAVREGIKKYSSWPTIPQIFLGGEFVGGCDIILEMSKSGDLAKALAAAGAVSK